VAFNGCLSDHSHAMAGSPISNPILMDEAPAARLKIEPAPRRGDRQTHCP
jgi:hypothetical protein